MGKALTETQIGMVKAAEKVPVVLLHQVCIALDLAAESESKP